MIDEFCPKKGLDLKSDNPDLYKRVCELDEVHKMFQNISAEIRFLRQKNN